MPTNFAAIGERIRGIRESCDILPEEMADELGVDLATYESWEETGKDVPISAVYHIATMANMDMNEILTGNAARLSTYHVVRADEGLEVDRLPGYHFQDLAWRYSHKIMQPLVVTLDPSDEPAALVTHEGQEFNYVLEGSMVVTFDNREFELHKGDSIYFNPMHRHGQRCLGDKPTKFLTIIAE